MKKQLLFLFTLVLFAGWMNGLELKAQTLHCAGEELCLTVSARGTVEWQQSPDAITFTAIGLGDTLCFVPVADAYYRAVISEGSCDIVISDTQYVTLLAGPIADAGGDRDLCLGDSLALGGSPTGSAGTPPYSYDWMPAAGINNTTANPMASPAVNTTYTLIVTDSNGCMAMDTASVFVNPLPTVDAGLDITSNCTTAVQIGGSPTASGGAGGYTYAWMPAAGLSSSTAANPMVQPYSTTTYTVIATDSLGCSGSDDVLVTLTGQPGTGTDTLEATATVQFFIVPPCVDTVFVRLWGAQGGGIGASAGANGGYAEGFLPVNSGDTLWVFVGTQGTPGPGGQNCNLPGGFNGGGATGSTCCSNAGGGAGGGGGGTDIRMGGQTLADRFIVAAGGGGSGSGQLGGIGGGLVGANGGTYNGVQCTGGTQTAGGFVGGHFTSHTCSIGTDGTFGQGGMGDGNDGGGGGGGWYGGGGGPNNGGGGGGSSYIGGVVNGSTTSGTAAGNGRVIISW